MCGRYELPDPKQLKRRFKTSNDLPLLKPRYNISPTQDLPVIVSGPTLEVMEWGFIPFWSKEKRGIINARAESVSEKPAFKKALQTQRCLVPAGGFYEWQQTKEGKVPYFIHLKDRDLFAFAGIYSAWKNPEGKEENTYAIITVDPNELMAPIHNRMPAILKMEDEETWLNPDITEPEKLLSLLYPYPANEMEAYPISKAVNYPKNDDSSILKPLA